MVVSRITNRVTKEEKFSVGSLVEFDSKQGHIYLVIAVGFGTKTFSLVRVCSQGTKGFPMGEHFEGQPMSLYTKFHGTIELTQE